MNALLLSASREGNTNYLEHAIPFISQFLDLNGKKHSNEDLNVVFIPFAGVTISYDQYTDMVKDAINELPINISGIHKFDDEKQAIRDCDVIMVGGGNTFELLNQLYKRELITTIKEKISNSGKYIGWSAGSNIAGSSIRTTNDMPIVQPESFEALALVPFQLNPHYTEYKAPGHNGETREMRIQEFMTLNPTQTVVGIEEGSALQLSADCLKLIGEKPAYVFQQAQKEIVKADSDLTHLLKDKSLN